MSELHVGPFKLDVAIGSAWVTVTDQNHVYVEFGHHINVDEEGPGNLRRGPITIRGIVYSGSLHAYRWADGQFHQGQESELNHNRHHSLYMSRVGQILKPVSDAARKTAADLLLVAINEWALYRQDAFQVAEERRLTREREERVEKIRELRASIAKLEAEIVSIEAELKEVL